MKKIEKTIEYMGRRRTVLLALSAAIVLMITYLLIMPAMTLDMQEAERQGGIDIAAEEQAGETEQADAIEQTEQTEPADADASAKAGQTPEDSKGESASAETEEEANLPLEEEETEADVQTGTSVIEAKDDTWEIAVTYGPEAGIPEGTELKVVEYSKEDPLFKECYSERKAWAADFSGSSENSSLKFEPGFGGSVDRDMSGELSDKEKSKAASMIPSAGAPAIRGYSLFDISLIYEGTEIEPAAPVQVTIQSANPKLQECDDISVGHFVESGEGNDMERSMETIDEVSCSTDDSKKEAQLIVDFEAASFSLYDVTGIQWTANQSKTVYFALKTGINKVLDTDLNGTIPVTYSQIENMNPSEVSAYIRSLPEYANAEPVIIYDKSGTDFYAIDGNGNLAQVYESGDTVMWTGQPSIGWKLIRYMNDNGGYTGYYDFINMETGKFLTPQANQTVGDTRIGVQLDGAAGHNTTIKAWDSSVNAYRGYSIRNGQLVTDESINWFFASVSQTEADDLKLQKVDTVDSSSMGITIKMIDYNGKVSNRREATQAACNITNSAGKDYDAGNVLQGLVKPRLNNGYPETIRGTSLSSLFAGAQPVNHLFIEQTYEETGYLEYSSFENYAALGADHNFDVYRQVGIMQNYSGDERFFFNRGNFLPYNQITDERVSAKNYNSYDEDGNPLAGDDPRKGENLFLTTKDADYYFGMSIDANFYQPEGGKYRGEDVVYEFNGDDDLWVFVDDVLILDIGGVHDAHSGSINFSTGKVQVETGRGLVTTTIKQCFKNAGVFPDGTRWDDAKAGQYFRGDTFADYSQHNMNMFYMERGAGASNLHMKFNLPVIKDAGKLIVDKTVSGTINQKYSNDKFPFQVIKVDGKTETRFTEAVYESNGRPVEYAHEAVINGTTYNDVFYLRPGEAAVFDVEDNSQQYYVKELGINTNYYDRVLINRERADISDGIAESSVSSVKNRNRVTYDNHGVTENLKIRKIVEGDAKSDKDAFEFYVYLTGQNKELIPYSNGDYYVLDPEGNYCTYVNGLPIGDPSITEETRTAYHSGQWGTIGSIPAGYTVLIPDLLVGTDFMVSERLDKNPEGYELKSIGVDAGTADTVDLVREYSNVKAGDAGAIKVGDYSYSNHCEGKLRKDAQSDARVTVTNQAANVLTVNKNWETNDFVTVHGPVKFALYKLDGGKEVFVEDSVKTLTAPATSIEYQITGNLSDYVVREVTVTEAGGEQTVTPVANNGVIEVSGETTKLGTNKTDSYIVTYQQGEAKGGSRTDTVTNTMPQLTVNKKDMTDDSQLAGAEFMLTIEDGETPLAGYDSLRSDDKESGNLLDGIYLSDGTYYLVETKAPAGFNQLPYKVKIVVDGDNTRIFTAATSPESETLISDQTPDNNLLYTFNVYNNPGACLPSAGGPGTTWIYLLGVILLLGCGSALIVRRRMMAGHH